QRREELHRGGVDDAAAASLRIRNERPGALEPRRAAFDQRLHAGESGITTAARGGEIHDAAVIVHEGADARCAGGSEGDEPHSSSSSNDRSARRSWSVVVLYFIEC